MRLFILYYIVFNVSLAFGECDKNVEYKPKGETVVTKCDLFLVEKDTMQSLKNNDASLKIAEKEIVKLKDLTIRQEELIQYRKDNELFLQNEIKKEQSRSFWKSTGTFVLGVLVTGLSAYVAIQATKD